MSELRQLQQPLLNFLLQELKYMLLDGEILKLVDLHPITSSLLDFLMSPSQLVMLPMEVSKLTFKFAPEELLDKILAKETVVVLSSLLLLHQTQLMLLSSVLYPLEETLVLSKMNQEYIPMFRALQMPSFKASSHNLPPVFHLQQLLPHHQV